MVTVKHDTPSDADAASRDGIVVLHGIFQPSLAMVPMCRDFRKNGYEVLNLGYPSTRMPIEEIAAVVDGRIAEFETEVGGRIHLLGYSMGGLVVRAFLKRRVPAALGRVVMVGTPNHGSEVADFLKSFPPYRYLYGPAGQQLVTDRANFRDIFADEGFDLGIVAGVKNGNPVTSRIIGKPSDGKVSLESTMLASAADHVVVHDGHMGLPRNREVYAHALHFIREGRFDHSPRPERRWFGFSAPIPVTGDEAH